MKQNIALAVQSIRGSSYRFWKRVVDNPLLKDPAGKERHGQDHDYPLHHGTGPAGQGTITYNDQPLHSLPSYTIARMGIGLVPEGRELSGGEQ